MRLTMKGFQVGRKNVLPTHLRAWFDLIRPFTIFVVGIISIIVMCLCLSAQDGNPLDHWRLIIQASFVLMIINASSNALNQATDINEDRISKPYRPIPLGEISLAEAKSLATLGYFFALCQAFFIGGTFFVLVIALVSLTLLYSCEPVRLKRYLFVNNATIGISRGFLGVAASFAVFCTIDSTTTLYLSMMAVFIFGAITTKDFTDAEADKMNGISNVVNKYGASKAILFIGIVSLAVCISMTTLVLFGVFKTLLIVVPMLIALFSYSCFKFRHSMEKTESNLVENNMLWAGQYLIFVVAVIIFAYSTTIG